MDKEITLPAPPEGYEYRLLRVTRKMPVVKGKDPEELTKKQINDLKYREKNRVIILEKKRLKYREKKESKQLHG